MMRPAFVAVIFAAFVTHKSYGFNVNVDWEHTTATSKTTTTLQVVVNPLLGSQCNVSEQAWQSLADLGADLVRYVPWFPYPQIAVAELQPPTATETFWNFTFLDEQLTKFMDATYEKNHTVVINFSTQPAWLYNQSTVPYPSNPWAVDWSYPPQAPLKDSSGKQMGEYYGRLLSWMTKGSFVDELGKEHTGGHNYKLTHWEVFNEVEGCHGTTPESYVTQFDVMVDAIRSNVPTDVAADMQFVGLALGGHRDFDWYQTFLNASNHAASARDALNYVSFHFYASCSNRTLASSYENFFVEANGFIDEVNDIIAIRDQLSPDTKLSIDEMGVILPNDNKVSAPVPPAIYYPAAGGMYAMLFGKLAALGVDVLGQSQLAGSPALPAQGIPDPQYPSVSLLDWNTGRGNARYWVLKLLIDHFAPGDSLVATTTTSSTVYSQAFVSKDTGTKKILMVNMKSTQQSLSLPSTAIPGMLYTVDEGTGIGPARVTKQVTTTVTFAPYATAVLVVN